MVKRFNVTVGTKYNDKKTNEEKTRWNNIGTITEFTKEDGSVSRMLELNMFPGVKYSIFEEKKKEYNNGGNGFNQGYSKPAKKESEEELPIVQADEEELDISDIPF